MGIKTYNIHIERGFDTKGISDSSRSSNRFGKDSFAKVRADEPSLVTWYVPHPSYACMKNCYPFKDYLSIKLFDFDVSASADFWCQLRQRQNQNPVAVVSRGLLQVNFWQTE